MNRLTVTTFLTSMLLQLPLSFSSPVYSNPKPVSLARIGCKSLPGAGFMTGGFRGYQPINQDIAIGLEVHRAVGRFGNDAGNGGIAPGKGPQITCRLAEPGQSSRFKTLSLSYGLPEQGGEGAWVKGNTAKVQLTIYLDGKSQGSRTLYLNDTDTWAINIAGRKSLAMTAECFNQSGHTCPPVIFYEDVLER